MTLLVLVIMPLTEMSLLMSLGFRSRITLVSMRLCGFVCRAQLRVIFAQVSSTRACPRPRACISWLNTVDSLVCA